MFRSFFGYPPPTRFENAADLSDVRSWLDQLRKKVATFKTYLPPEPSVSVSDIPSASPAPVDLTTSISSSDDERDDRHEIGAELSIEADLTLSDQSLSDPEATFEWHSQPQSASRFSQPHRFLQVDPDELDEEDCEEEESLEIQKYDILSELLNRLDAEIESFNKNPVKEDAEAEKADLLALVVRLREITNDGICYGSGTLSERRNNYKKNTDKALKVVPVVATFIAASATPFTFLGGLFAVGAGYAGGQAASHVVGTGDKTTDSMRIVSGLHKSLFELRQKLKPPSQIVERDYQIGIDRRLRS